MNETLLTTLYAPLGIAVGDAVRHIGKPKLIPIVNALLGGFIGFGLGADAGLTEEALSSVRWPWMISVLVGVASGLGSTVIRKAAKTMLDRTAK